jgi:hypothetical protein
MALGNTYTVNLDTGAIRYASGASVDTILDLHAYLQDLADNATGLDNDNPSKLAGKRDATKPSVLTLPNDGRDATAFNIDDTCSQYLKFGSIEQSGAATLYSGLKTIGAIVASSPIYVVQNAAKLSTWWANGHIQILVKVKASSTLIDSGNVTAYSRKYGQTYSHFDANLAAGSETAAAITTQLDGSIVASVGAAATLYGGMSTSVGTVSHDLGNGNGAKNYDAELNCNGKTAQEIYDAVMWLCSSVSTASVSTTEGWRFRSLNGSYAENPQRPIVTLTSGTLYFERGWYPTNMDAGVSYSLIAADGTIQAPPVTTGWTQRELVSGDGVLVARATGGAINKSVFTVAAGGATAGGTSVVVKEAIPADTRAVGTIRVSGDRYRYASFATSTFTLATASTGTVTTADATGITLTNSSATFVTDGVEPGDIVRNTTDGSKCAVKSITSQTVLVTEGLTGGSDNGFGGSDAYTINRLAASYAENTGVYAPLLDDVATGTTMSCSVTYVSDRDLIIVVRNGNLVTPIQPYIATSTLTSTAGSNNTIRNSEV